MKVQGVNIAVKNPLYRKDSKIKLSKEAEKQLQEESLDKLDKLEVVYVGNSVANVKPKDNVFVDLHRLANAPRVVIENEAFIFIREGDIIFIY